MNGWTKHLYDGNMIVGEDSLVRAKKVSWRKSPLDNLAYVTLEHNGVFLKIAGAKQYWQSDEYESVFPGPMTKLQKRRIQCLIDNEVQFLNFNFRSYNNEYEIFLSNQAGGNQSVAIQDEWRNKWLVLTYDVARGCIYHNFLENKI